MHVYDHNYQKKKYINALLSAHKYFNQYQLKVGRWEAWCLVIPKRKQLAKYLRRKNAGGV